MRVEKTPVPGPASKIRRGPGRDSSGWVIILASSFPLGAMAPVVWNEEMNSRRKKSREDFMGVRTGGQDNVSQGGLVGVRSPGGNIQVRRPHFPTVFLRVVPLRFEVCGDNDFAGEGVPNSFFNLRGLAVGRLE